MHNPQQHHLRTKFLLVEQLALMLLLTTNYETLAGNNIRSTLHNAIYHVLSMKPNTEKPKSNNTISNASGNFQGIVATSTSTTIKPPTTDLSWLENFPIIRPIKNRQMSRMQSLRKQLRRNLADSIKQALHVNEDDKPAITNQSNQNKIIDNNDEPLSVLEILSPDLVASFLEVEVDRPTTTITTTTIKDTNSINNLIGQESENGKISSSFDKVEESHPVMSLNSLIINNAIQHVARNVSERPKTTSTTTSKTTEASQIDDKIQSISSESTASVQPSQQQNLQISGANIFDGLAQNVGSLNINGIVKEALKLAQVSIGLFGQSLITQLAQPIAINQNQRPLLIINNQTKLVGT